MITYVTGARTKIQNKILKLMVDHINHSAAVKNLEKFPQLAIFSFDSIGLNINLYGRYESAALNLVETFIKSKIEGADTKVVIDIGANIGNHSVFLSNFFKKVYAFEPNPVTFELLTINTKYAPVKNNIEVFNFGLSDTNALLPFSVNPHNIGGSFISEEDENEFPKIKVQVKKLDDINEVRDEPISLIKIDVEGHELKVLRGAQETITKWQPAIIFEQHASEIVNGSSAAVRLLSDLNYEFYEIRKNFFFGETKILRLTGSILRFIYGEQLSFNKVTKFRNKFYDMILAVPIKETP